MKMRNFRGIRSIGSANRKKGKCHERDVTRIQETKDSEEKEKAAKPAA
jgi:hypothetical protein